MQANVRPARQREIRSAVAGNGLAHRTMAGHENGGRGDVWLAEQASYDLWQARKRFKQKVKRAAMTAD